MSDTVTASVIVASLADSGPSFVLDPGTGDLASCTATSPDAGSFHVDGGAHASPVSGFGSPLLVDFVTWRAEPSPNGTPPTVSGGASGAFQDAIPGIAGALQVAFAHLF